MGTDRTVPMVALAALLALITLGALMPIAACSDGGPPSPFHRHSMRDAPTTAADGGEGQSSDHADDSDDAGETNEN